MARPKKRKLRVKQRAQVRKKGENKNNSLPRMQAQMPRTTGAVLKVKMKKKND